MPLSCQYGTATYGPIIFYGVVHAVTNSENVLADDGVATKLVRTIYELEIILTEDSVQWVDAPFYIGTDQYMDKLKKVLSTKNLDFNFAFKGFGTFIADSEFEQGEYVGDGQGASYPITNSISNLLTTTPQILSWESLGANRAARVKWRVVVDKLPCINVQSHETSIPIHSYKDVTISANGEDITIFRYYILSHTQEDEVEIKEDGCQIYSKIGSITIYAITHVDPNVAPDEAPLLHNRVPLTRQLLVEFLEVMFGASTTRAGFHRTRKFRVSKDHHTVNFTVIDTEIPSDNPSFPFMVKCDVEHTVRSSLIGKDPYATGFKTWRNVMTGNFSVRPGVRKELAYLAFFTYVFNRRGKPLAGNIGLVEKFNKDQANRKILPENEGAFVKDRKRERVRQITLDFSIKEKITGRDIAFSLEYCTFNGLDNLLAATGIMRPVKIAWQEFNYPNDLGKLPTNPDNPGRGTEFEWAMHNSSMPSHYTTPIGRRVNLPGSLLYSICDNFAPIPIVDEASQPTIYSSWGTEFKGHKTSREVDFPQGITGQDVMGKGPSTTTPNTPARYQSTYMNGVEPADSWIRYHSEQEIHEKTNAIFMSSIDNVGSGHLYPANVGYIPSTTGIVAGNVATDETVLTSFAKGVDGLRLNGDTGSNFTQDSYKYFGPMVTGQPIFFVRVKGSALRIGYEIPMPVLLGMFSDDTTSSISESYALCPAVRVGNPKFKCNQVAVTADGPVYEAMWDIVYAIHGDINSGSIRFRMSNPSEFV